MPKPRICSLDWLRTRSLLLLVATSVLVPILLINPFREMLSEDDSWAYARMVEHLLKTGKYELDAWSAANMPVQIYLAAAASKVAGYSLSILRGTTLTLFLVGVTSFYLLLREFRPRQSCRRAGHLCISCESSGADAGLHLYVGRAVSRLVAADTLDVCQRISRASLAPILLASIAVGCAIGRLSGGTAEPRQR
jgi:hypothetical protein